MRRIFSIFLLLLFLLAACDTFAPEPEPEPNEPEPTTEPDGVFGPNDRLTTACYAPGHEVAKNIVIG